MKIKVKAILRSPNLTADIGDIINVDEKTGNLLINADAAEMIQEVVKVKVEVEPTKIEAEIITPEVKEVVLERKEQPKPVKKGAFRK